VKEGLASLQQSPLSLFFQTNHPFLSGEEFDKSFFPRSSLPTYVLPVSSINLSVGPSIPPSLHVALAGDLPYWIRVSNSLGAPMPSIPFT